MAFRIPGGPNRQPVAAPPERRPARNTGSSSASRSNWGSLTNEKREDVLKVLYRVGYVAVRQKGSHLTLFHAEKNVKKTFSGHAKSTVSPTQIKDLMQSIGLTAEDYHNAK